MKYLFYFVITLVTLLFQSTFIELISIRGVQPDLLLILVVLIGLRESRSRATIIGFAIGLLQDLFATSLFGLSALAKSLVGFLVVTIAKRRVIGNYQRITLVFILSALLQGIVFSFVLATGIEIKLLHVMFRYQLPSVIYTTIIGLVIAAFIPINYWRSIRKPLIHDL